jgi:ABC-type transport system involved in cytochrome bd biosynthesis fused ATPase/permease subunit
MSIGAALALIAVGAILKWAVTAHVNGFDLQTAGTVLFVIGIFALIIAVAYAFWWPLRDGREDPGYPEDQPPPRRYR